MSQRRDGRGGHRACKIIHGDRWRQSRVDNFGDMLDLLGEGHDPGLLQVRNVLFTLGEGGAGSVIYVGSWCRFGGAAKGWPRWTHAQELLELDREHFELMTHPCRRG